MMDKELETRIRHALDAEMSGLRVTSSRREEMLRNAIGGRKVKRKMTVGLVLAIVLILTVATAMAVTVALLTAQEVVEDVAVPMAQGNDRDWRVTTDFSPEELAAFIRACSENGIDLDENHQIMEAIRNGEGYDEEEAIMAVCRVAFGGNYGSWTIAQRHWFSEMMVEIGFANEVTEELPGPDDLPEEEARAILIAALKSEYGEDIGIEDRERYEVMLVFTTDPDEENAFWQISCYERGEPATRYFANMDRQGNVLRTVAVPVEVQQQPMQQEEDPLRLTKEEATVLAAEGIRRQTGREVPFEDPEQYHSYAWKQLNDRRGWEVHFVSHTADWGYCEAFVDDETNEVTLLQTDVGEITADNILARYRSAKGWYDEWDTSVWAEIAEKAADLPASDMVGKVTKATPWIAWREGLLTRDEAEEKAFRQAGVRMGEVNCVCLIDADPNPIWKFRILPYDESYQDSIVVEIDAVTGEMTDLDMYKSDHQDLEPSFHMVTLRRIWSRLEYEESGPLYIARLAVLHKFADNTFDMPEVDSLPIFDLRYWQPEIDGNTVRFVSRWSDLPDYEVTLDENGMAVSAEEKESGGREPMPEELQPECIDESLYGVNYRAMADATERYGMVTTLWPLEVQLEVFPEENRTLPREGEMTREEAVAYAKAIVSLTL